MPYISQGRREDFDSKGRTPRTPGELNYVITRAVMDYLEQRKLYQKTNTYTDMADVLSALEGAKMEFYRRVVTPYEEQKRFDNGDVYE